MKLYQFFIISKHNSIILLQQIAINMKWILLLFLRNILFKLHIILFHFLITSLSISAFLLLNAIF